MKILLVTMDYPPPMGGIQTLTRNLYGDLIENGHEVCLVNFDGRNQNNLSKLRPIHFTYTKATKNEYFAINNILNPTKLLLPSGLRDFVYNNLIYIETNSIRRLFSPDLTHIMKPSLFAAIYHCKEPFVVSCHGEEIVRSFPIIYSLQNASLIHCVSRYSSSLVAQLVDRKESIEVIYNSVDTTRYNNPSVKKENIIVSCCRLVKRKNIESVIRAFSLIPESLKKIYKYCIIGEGPEKKFLISLVQELKLGNVEFLGQVSEIDKLNLLKKAKIFILCPRPFFSKFEANEEGFGISFIEAQAAGTPVIGSRIGGIPEAIGDGGLLIEDPGNIQEISNSLSNILLDPILWTNLQNNCANRIKHFDRMVTFRQYEEMYQMTSKRKWEKC